MNRAKRIHKIALDIILTYPEDMSGDGCCVFPSFGAKDQTEAEQKKERKRNERL